MPSRRIDSPNGVQKVLLLGEIEHAHESWNELSTLAELVTPCARSRKAFLDECKSGRLNGVRVILRTFDSVGITGRFDEQLVQALPQSVKFVCHNGAGYDQVDVDACSRRNIKVSNTPGAVNNSTADLNMFLILGGLRRLNAPMTSIRDGQWRGQPPPPLGHEPEGKILGILGMGGIGRNLKKKADAFSMQVIYHNRHRLSEELADSAEYVSFEELLSRSDVISLNLPLNSHTRHMISTREFAMMKPGVIIVNTARGGIIDEAALVRALDSGHVASVGLDVYENEPEVHPGLLANPHVMLVPHMGTWTVESVLVTLRHGGDWRLWVEVTQTPFLLIPYQSPEPRRDGDADVPQTQTAMEETAIANVRSVLETGWLKNIVPEQASSSDGGQN